MNGRHHKLRQVWLGRLASLLMIAMLTPMVSVSALAESTLNRVENSSEVYAGLSVSNEAESVSEYVESAPVEESFDLMTYEEEDSEGSEKSRETERSVLETPVITGFTGMGKSNYEFTYKPDLDTLKNDFPSEITAEIENADSVEVPLEWDCDDFYSRDYGDFIFTAELIDNVVRIQGNEWDISDLIIDNGVSLPQIHVTVRAMKGFKPLETTSFAFSTKPRTVEEAIQAMHLPSRLESYDTDENGNNTYDVTWLCPEYDAALGDEYVFTASFERAQYVLEEGVEMPSVTMNVITSDEFDIDNLNNKNRTLTITGWKMPGNTLVVPREIEGFTVTAIADRAFAMCPELVSVEFPDSIRSYGQELFGLNQMIQSVKLEIGSDYTVLYQNYVDGKTMFTCGELDVTTTYMPLQVTDIEVLSGSMLVLNSEYTIPTDHEFFVDADDPETIELDGGIVMNVNGNKLINRGIMIIDDTATFMNSGSLYSCDIFSYCQGKIEGNQCIREHTFNENGLCAYCQAKHLIVTAEPEFKPTKVYDGTVDCDIENISFNIANLNSDEDVRITSAVAEYDAATVGQHQVTVYFDVDEISNPNEYNYVIENAVFDSEILPRTLEVVPEQGQSKIYGDPDSELIYSVSGLIGEDQLTGNIERLSGENVGRYQIFTGTLNAGDNYEIVIPEVYYEIEPKSIDAADIQIATLETQAYTGEAVEPAIRLMDGSNELISGVDYEVSYQDNVEIGTATAVISGIGNYAGSRSDVTFDIAEKVEEVSAELTEEGAQVIEEAEPTPEPTDEETVVAEEAVANDSTEDGWQYIPNTTNNTATITGWTGTGNVLSVPEKVADYTVVAIGDEAFKTKNEITEVYLPVGLTTIGDQAFADCAKLTTVNLPDTLTTIGENAFGTSNAIDTVRLFITSGYTELRSATSYAHEAGSDPVVLPLTVTDISVNEKCALYLDVEFTIPVGHEFTVDQNGQAAVGSKGVLVNRGSITNSGSFFNDGTIYSCQSGSTITGTIIEDQGGQTIKTHVYDATTGQCAHCSSKLLKISLAEGKSADKVYDGTVSSTLTAADFKIDNLAEGETATITAAEATYNEADASASRTLTVKFTIQTSSPDLVYNDLSLACAITPRPIGEGVDFTAIEDQKHTGKAIKPAVILKYGDVSLNEGYDFIAEYKDNIKVGQASIVITGAVNYTGTRTEHFNIVNIDKKDRKLELSYKGDKPSKVYDGKTYANMLRSEDFEPTNAKKSEVKITGVSATYDTIHVGSDKKVTVHILISQTSDDYYYTVDDFTIKGEITKKDLTITPNAGQEFNYGDEIKGIKYAYAGLLSDDTIEGALSVESTNVGKPKITVGTIAVKNIATGNKTNDYNIIVENQTVTINAKNINDLAYGGISKQKYTGYAIQPEIVLKNGSKVQLKEKTDFTVTYKNNVEVGTANVTITGIGNYTGTRTPTFEITKKPLSDSDIRIGSISDQKYTGSAIEPSVEVTYKTKDNSRKLVKGTDYEVSYSDNTKRGTAKVTITAKSNSNYTGSRRTTFKITGSSSDDDDDDGDDDDDDNTADEVVAARYGYMAESEDGYRYLLINTVDRTAEYYDVHSKTRMIGSYTGNLSDGIRVEYGGDRFAEITFRSGVDSNYQFADFTMNGEETPFEMGEAAAIDEIIEPHRGQQYGVLMVGSESLGQVLFTQEGVAQEFASEEQSATGVQELGDPSSTVAARGIKIIAQAMQDANGNPVYLDQAQTRQRYAPLHLRLTKQQIERLKNLGFVEVEYVVEDAHLRIALDALNPNVVISTKDDENRAVQMLRPVDLYDFCIEQVEDGRLTQAEADALKGKQVQRPLYRVDANAVSGDLTAPVATDIEGEDDSEELPTVEDFAPVPVNYDRPASPDEDFVAARLGYVADINGIAVYVEDAGDEVEFVDPLQPEEFQESDAEEAELQWVESDDVKETTVQTSRPVGYVGKVVFSLRVLSGTWEQRKTSEQVLADGIRGGGIVEIFETVQDARNRDNALNAFDGTIFSSSHRQVGACVLRLSMDLRNDERDQIEDCIVRALASESVMAVSSSLESPSRKLFPMLSLMNQAAVSDGEAQAKAKLMIAMGAEAPANNNATQLFVPGIEGKVVESALNYVEDRQEGYAAFYPTESGLCGVLAPEVVTIPDITEDFQEIPEASEPVDAQASTSQKPEAAAEPQPAQPQGPVDPEPMYAYVYGDIYWLLNTQNHTVEVYNKSNNTYRVGDCTGSLAGGMTIVFRDDGSTTTMGLKFQQTYQIAQTQVNGTPVVIKQAGVQEVENIMKGVRR